MSDLKLETKIGHAIIMVTDLFPDSHAFSKRYVLTTLEECKRLTASSCVDKTEVTQ